MAIKTKAPPVSHTTGINRGSPVDYREVSNQLNRVYGQIPSLQHLDERNFSRVLEEHGLSSTEIQNLWEFSQMKARGLITETPLEAETPEVEAEEGETEEHESGREHHRAHANQHTLHGTRHDLEKAAELASFGTGDIIESNPLYAQNLNTFREEWSKKRQEALTGWHEENTANNGEWTAAPKPPDEPTMSSKNYKNYSEYEADLAEHKTKMEEFNKKNEAYQAAREQMLESKGLGKAQQDDYFLGSADPNVPNQTIHEQAKITTKKQLEEISKQNTLAGRKAGQLLQKYNAAEIEIHHVRPQDDPHIQLMQQRIQQNLEVRKNRLFMEMKRLDPTLTEEQFLKHSRYLDLRDRIHRAELARFQRNHPEKSKQYEGFLKRQELLHANIQSEERKKALAQLKQPIRRRMAQSIGQGWRIHVTNRASRLEERLANANPIGSALHYGRCLRGSIAQGFRNYGKDIATSWHELGQRNRARLQAILHPVKSFQNSNFYKQAHNLFTDPKKFIQNLNVYKTWNKRYNRVVNTAKFIFNKKYRANVLNNFAEKWIKRWNNIKKFGSRMWKGLKFIGRGLQNVGRALLNVGRGLLNVAKFGLKALQLGLKALQLGVNVLSKIPAIASLISTVAGLVGNAIGFLAGTAVPALMGAIAAVGGFLLGVLAAIVDAIIALIAILIPLLPIIIIVISVIAVVIAIFMILLSTASQSITYTQVACSDQQVDQSQLSSYAASTFNTELAINDQFQNIDQSTSYYQTGINTQKKVINDLCIIFGHIHGNKNDNTLGQYFKGVDSFLFPAARAVGRGSIITIANIDLLFSDSNNHYKDCFVNNGDNIMKNGPAIPSNTAFQVNIENPDKCSDSVLQFYIARTIGRAVAERSKSYSGAHNVFASFQKDVFAGKSPTLLPNSLCQKTKKGEDCFADMVADYVTWGFGPLDFTPGAASGGTLTAFAQKFVTDMKNRPASVCDHVPAGAYLGGFTKINLSDWNKGCIPANELTKDALYYIDYSVHNFPAMQCVNFVQAMVAQVGKPFNTSGNAIDFATIAVPKGYIFHKNDGNPLAGDIAIWSKGGGPNGQPGHIAIILGTTPDKKYLQVAEGNGFGNGEVDIVNAYPIDANTPINGLYLYGWLRAQ